MDKTVFGFNYQIEIYVPAPKRIYGYYVLPFLLGEGFAGRVDLRADRKTSTLLVQAAYVEAGADPKAVAEALAGELHHMARWLDLEGITVVAKGNLAKPLLQPSANVSSITAWVEVARDGRPQRNVSVGSF